MNDKILWEYLDKLPEQESAWREWHSCLVGWHRFNTFYTHYLRVEDSRANFLECATSCEHGCPRRIVEISPSDITAVCTRGNAEPMQLKFRDILVYSLRREAFHQALCASLNINYSEDRRKEHEHIWHLGEYSGTEVYLTYETSMLTDTISSLYLSQQKPFILMVPTVKNITPEIQQFLTRNNSVLLSMADELTLQADGSFKSERSISECMKLSEHGCSQANKSPMLPIEAYKYLVYNDL